jgi:hypothetical protein
MRRLAFAVGLGALFTLRVVIVPANVGAQTTPDSGSVCFEARPLPECKTFWLTEAGYYRPVIGTGSTQRNQTAGFDGPELARYYSWELGGMSNRSRRTAVGATFLIGMEGRFGLKGRYRRWLPNRGFVDASAGALRAMVHLPAPHFDTPSYGITGDVALGWRDWAAITVRADALRGGGRTTAALYGGVHLGSYPAVLATAAAIAYGVCLGASFAGGAF